MKRKVTEADLVVGAKLLSQAGHTYNVVAGPDANLCYVIQRPGGGFVIVFRDALMAYEVAPLCIVEGRPVYKGDRLYDPKGIRHTIERISNGALFGSSNPGYGVSEWSWEPPCEEITGWIAVQKYTGLQAIAGTSNLYQTEAEAHNVFTDNCVVQQVTLKVRK